ncbi:DUF423 domain-containing protein [Alteromonas sp. IB21]|uniref:DUF423 domain-containing protein n=1 Tax=Alteromonas sp. IB21 TaxID=2779369 RepID=UPI0018E7839A|nr:DUF423 domain-containing protein [Alteromonas sp. IB21]MBJ2128833.1 DUF423 domain-containing protein [Alteromonas sp. IB21]
MKNENIGLATIAKPYLIIGALLAGLAVVLGAFGAHGLKSLLTSQQLNTFEIGVRYQMYHALALLLLPALSITSTWGNRVAFCFVIGTVLFSGSLYALSISGIKWFGPITPLGGLFFIVGWGLLVIGLIKGHKSVKQQASQKPGASNV